LFFELLLLLTLLCDIKDLILLSPLQPQMALAAAAVAGLAREVITSVEEGSLDDASDSDADSLPPLVDF
jgi:hypothetical protein